MQKSIVDDADGSQQVPAVVVAIDEVSGGINIS